LANTQVLNSEEFLEDFPFHPAYAEPLPIAKDFWNVPEYINLLDVLQSELYKYVVGGEGTALDAVVRISIEQDRILRTGDGEAATSISNDDERNTTAVIVGCVVGGILLLVIVFMAYCMYKLQITLKEMEKKGETVPLMSALQRLSSVRMDVGSVIESAKKEEENGNNKD
jgi:hypothetical protein